MVWSGIKACGVGSLHILKSTVSADEHVEGLEQVKLQSAQHLDGIKGSYQKKGNKTIAKIYQ